MCVLRKELGAVDQGRDTHPGDLTVEEAMKDVLVGQDGMASETIEEGLEHSFPLGDHGMVFPCLGLLDRIVSEGLLGRDGRNDERWVQFDEVQTQRLEIRIAMPRFDALEEHVCQKPLL